MEAAILQFSQDSQRFCGKDRLDTAVLPARAQGCRGELNWSVTNISRYSTKKRQIPSSAAGFGSGTNEATGSCSVTGRRAQSQTKAIYLESSLALL